MKTLFFKTCPMFSSMLIVLSIYLSTINHRKKHQFMTFMVMFLLVCMYTHRVPENLNIIKEQNLIVSPAFGKVVEIGTIEDHTRICIFLNLDDVHVQYLPTDGTIIKKVYKPGEFNPANLIEKGEANERMETYIKPSYNSESVILVNQIAGILARTIIHFKGEGDQLNKGDLMGIIQFGSRVDIYIPTRDIDVILVSVNDVVKGPETALVKIK